MTCPNSKNDSFICLLTFVTWLQSKMDNLEPYWFYITATLQHAICKSLLFLNMISFHQNDKCQTVGYCDSRNLHYQSHLQSCQTLYPLTQMLIYQANYNRISISIILLLRFSMGNPYCGDNMII